MAGHFKETIFITGITGFTGKHLEDYFVKQGFCVYGTTFSESYSKNHIVCDILEEKTLSGIISNIKPDFIIHLAAISFVAAADQKHIYNVNIFGTLNVLNAIERLEYKPKKILIASSAAVYGNIEGALSEDMCPKPVNHYGNSKLAMENMVRPYFNRLNIIIVRPFNYTGIGQENHFLIPKIISHYVKNKKEIELGNIDVYREFNNVKFVIKSYSELLFSSTKSEIFNVCTGHAINIKSIINSMDNLANYNIKVKINPKFVRENEIKILKGNPQKLFSCIGDFSTEISMEETLEEMYNNIS
ncbi:GDP-mannose 4,6-dehydratase [Maribacter sp. ANRC-HE7]|uniref:GDP-mannose 4,6-dehydratase n=1 Tax=Maribacter aquimaris TaxID=2737171 RepID=A0ABR7V4H3_9FLAO|nr:GDP-mannose 4,6-dehydratase [Maribacter aquimaris]MBD0779694.1 GDP-mannose 4,6-dehydratase [Maribacter aquimaris]